MPQGSATEPAQLFFVACDTGCVLMPHDGRIDHLHGRIMACCQRIHKLIPHASPAPANEAIVAGGVRAKVVRQIAPRARTQDPKDAVERLSIGRSILRMSGRFGL